MSAFLGLAQFWLLAALGFAAVVALASAVIQPALADRLQRSSATLRHRIYLAWSVAPLGVGMGLATLLLLPSVLSALGWLSDHCHLHDHLHLCLLHPPALSSNLLGLGVLGLFGAMALLHGAASLRALSGARQMRKTLECDSSGASDCDVVQVTHPAALALTIGLWKPRIFVTDELMRPLPAVQRRVVLAHERAHARRRDGLWGLVAQGFSLLHLPHTRRALLSEMHLAAEEVCDAEAAALCGDRLCVAETILAVARRMNVSTACGGFAVPALIGSSVERRVKALLRPLPTARWSRLWIAAVPVLLLLLVVTVVEPLHHGTETLLTYWFS